MKKLATLIFSFLCIGLSAQIQQKINKNSGAILNTIASIDSIRFNTSSAIMEVVFQDGTVVPHSISQIVNVNFISTSQHTCGTGNVHNPNLTYGNLTDQEGNNYKTIVIGNQEWMAENLKTSVYRNGDTIVNVTDNAQWFELTSAACCSYQNDSKYDCPLGKLYNWYAVADERNLCPAGWHVPTDDEWNTLLLSLDPATNTTAIGFQSTTAGSKLKSVGTLYWASPNEFASNESGFSALPAGARNYNIGEFYNGVSASFNNGVASAWWSSTMNGSSGFWFRNVEYSTEDVYRGLGWGQMGFSVRCLRD